MPLPNSTHAIAATEMIQDTGCSAGEELRKEPKGVSVLLRNADQILTHPWSSSGEVTESSYGLGVKTDGLSSNFVESLVSNDKTSRDHGRGERSEL